MVSAEQQFGKKLDLNLQSATHGVRSRPTAKKRTPKAKRQDKANFARKLHETQWIFFRCYKGHR